MKVCVLGLWHLGSVTSACLASVGHRVVGLDFDRSVVDSLQGGSPPLYEPGLQDLVKAGLAQGNLSYTADPASALSDAEVVWVTFDTPVDETDEADVGAVIDRVKTVFPHLPAGSLVLLSSQLPVGTTRRLENEFRQMQMKSGGEARAPHFAYSPENLRLGKALSAFLQPDRIVVGIRQASDRAVLEDLLHPITDRIEWMSVESAEMTKHAINAFLATSVAFINEIAALCEAVGADAREVERGLRSEARIGPHAYLTPGSAYAGGTLARDIGFLQTVGRERGIATPLFAGVRASNDAHAAWPRRMLERLVGNLRGQTIAIWGLAYKAGTDTLRRSSAIDLCRWLVKAGAVVRVHDPVIDHLPEDLQDKVTLAATPEGAAEGARVLIVATQWPEYRTLPAAPVLAGMAGEPIVLDPNRFLDASFRVSNMLRYVSVGDSLERVNPEQGLP